MKEVEPLSEDSVTIATDEHKPILGRDQSRLPRLLRTFNTRQCETSTAQGELKRAGALADVIAI